MLVRSIVAIGPVVRIAGVCHWIGRIGLAIDHSEPVHAARSIRERRALGKPRLPLGALLDITLIGVITIVVALSSHLGVRVTFLATLLAALLATLLTTLLATLLTALCVPPLSTITCLLSIGVHPAELRAGLVCERALLPHPLLRKVFVKVNGAPHAYLVARIAAFFSITSEGRTALEETKLDTLHLRV
eukprot:scaffold121108_cov28-Tisochrysis_lutea.AAC.3